jgi:hypothetical protein
MAFNTCGRFSVTTPTPHELLLFSMTKDAMVTVLLADGLAASPWLF